MTIQVLRSNSKLKLLLTEHVNHELGFPVVGVCPPKSLIYSKFLVTEDLVFLLQ